MIIDLPNLIRKSKYTSSFYINCTTDYSTYTNTLWTLKNELEDIAIGFYHGNITWIRTDFNEYAGITLGINLSSKWYMVSKYLSENKPYIIDKKEDVTPKLFLTIITSSCEYPYIINAVYSSNINQNIDYIEELIGNELEWAYIDITFTTSKIDNIDKSTTSNYLVNLNDRTLNQYTVYPIPKINEGIDILIKQMNNISNDDLKQFEAMCQKRINGNIEVIQQSITPNDVGAIIIKNINSINEFSRVKSVCTISQIPTTKTLLYLDNNHFNHAIVKSIIEGNYDG